MSTREIFGALEHLDKTEGRGGTRVAAWFVTKLEAKKFGDEIDGVFGTRNDLGVTEATLYDTAVEHPEFNEPEAIRNRRIRALEHELDTLREL